MAYRDDREAEIYKLKAKIDELQGKLGDVEPEKPQRPPSRQPWINHTDYIEIWKKEAELAQARKSALNADDETIWSTYFQAILTTHPEHDPDICASKAVEAHRERFR
jgi:hypothetical protein